MRNFFKGLLQIELLKYLPFIILFPIVINFMLFQAKLPFAYGDGDVWLGFWGNYSGGVLSAIVAYLVANSQIQKQAKLTELKDKRDRVIAQLPSLVRIKFELEDYIGQLERVSREHLLETDKMKFQVSTSPLVGKELDEMKARAKGDLITRKFKIELLDKGIYQLIEKVENDEIHIKLIELLKFYEDFTDAISFYISISFRNMYTFDKDYSISPEALEEKQRKIEQSDEVARYIIKKRNFWKHFFEENMIEQFKEVLEKVNNEIEIVKQEKSR